MKRLEKMKGKLRRMDQRRLRRKDGHMKFKEDTFWILEDTVEREGDELVTINDFPTEELTEEKLEELSKLNNGTCVVLILRPMDSIPLTPTEVMEVHRMKGKNIEVECMEGSGPCEFFVSGIKGAEHSELQEG